MLLVIDIGNTNTSLGVFDGETLTAHWRLTTARARTEDEWGGHVRNLFALADLLCDQRCDRRPDYTVAVGIEGAGSQ